MKPDPQKAFLKNILEKSQEVDTPSGRVFTGIVIAGTDKNYYNFIKYLGLRDDDTKMLNCFIATTDNEFSWQEMDKETLKHLEFVIMLPHWKRGKTKKFISGVQDFLKSFYEL